MNKQENKGLDFLIKNEFTFGQLFQTPLQFLNLPFHDIPSTNFPDLNLLTFFPFFTIVPNTIRCIIKIGSATID